MEDYTYEEIKPMDFWDLNPIIEGFVRNKELVPSQIEGKPDYWKYTITKDDGEDVTFNGSKLLDPRFSTAEIGSRIRITFLGWSEGNNRYRNFLVEKGTLTESAKQDVAEGKIDATNLPF